MDLRFAKWEVRKNSGVSFFAKYLEGDRTKIGERANYLTTQNGKQGEPKNLANANAAAMSENSA